MLECVSQTVLPFHIYTVLAAELSRQLQEDYGIQSEATISEMEVVCDI